MTRRIFNFLSSQKTDSETASTVSSESTTAVSDSATVPDNDHLASAGTNDGSVQNAAVTSPQTNLELPVLEGPDHFDLTLEKNMLRLPALTLSIPEGAGPIHDVELDIAVAGGPDGLGRYIQEAYSTAVSRLKATVKQTITIEPQPVGRWTEADGFERLQPIVLDFTMSYLLSNHRGKRSDRRHTVEQQVTLHPDESLQSRFKAEVKPSLIRVFDRKASGPKLEVRVRNVRNNGDHADTDVKPKLRTNSPDLAERIREWGIPKLQTRAEEMLNKIISQRSSDGNGGWIARGVPRLDLNDEETARLLKYRAQSGRPLRFTVRFSVDGSPFTTITIELLPHENSFAGVVGIDLGTHGSVVVINDPAITDSSTVPREQVICLQKRLGRWVKRPSTNPFDDVKESQWLGMLTSVATAMNLDSGDALDGIEAIIDKAHQSLARRDQLFELLRQFELAVNQIPGRGRRHVQQSLYEILHDVFDEFPLTMWHLRPVEFSDGEVMQPHTSSELELTDIVPETRGEIGFDAAHRHQAWLRSGERDDSESVCGNIGKGRFFRNPKASLDRMHLRDAEDHAVIMKDGSEAAVSPCDIVSSAYGSLLDRFEDCRSLYGLSNGPLDRAVVTYPASLLPEPREKFVEILKQHGMRHVNRMFDEAVAPAIFYMEQRFSDAPEIGPEAFKIRCTRLGDVWHHQMLIVDVGAGTTDIALIQIQMRETRSTVEPGNGGRIYTISPRLLGSTGREHLGGNLITLLLYRRLKLMLVDWLWQQKAAAQAGEDIQALDDRGSLLPDTALDEFDFLRNDGRLKKALDEAEEILATRFRDRPDSQTESDAAHKADKTARFFAIWEIAEALKIEFSRVLAEEAQPSGLPLESLIRPRLKQIVTGTDFDGIPLDAIDEFPEFRTEDFVSLASPVVEQATQLAYALTTESLNRLNRTVAEETGQAPGLTVDSIVLSGRSSQLPMFRESLETFVRRGAPFGSNRTEILYHNRYAKLATATGAVRGQRLMSLAPMEPNTEELAAGQCSRNLDIRNLFFFLPSSFKLGTQEGQLGKTIFEMHEQFRHHDFTPIGRLRTEWGTTTAAETLIYRTEGEDQSATGRLWGQMLLKELADTVGLSIDELLDSLQVRFEITHELDLYAMLRRSGTENRQLVYSSRDASTPPECIVKVPDNVWKKLMGNNAGGETLSFPVFAGEPKNDDAIPLISRGTRLSAVCNVGTTETPDLQPAIWSDNPLPPIKVREKAYNLYTRDPRSGAAVLLAHFDLDSLTATEHSKFAFETRYRVLIAADGTIALICGDEPPFWMTHDSAEWINNDGQVLRYKLPRHQPAEDFWRDPFCGRH